ncbi:MAG: ABC transporter permease [Chloroflexi bacterium]|nr:MAG: ABC transporter permease [Chloroflexota bacterium]
MSTVGLALRQVRFENKSFWRNPAAAYFTFAFPIVFLILFNLLFGHGHLNFLGHSVSTSTFYVPAIAAFSVITACYTNIAMSLSIARDSGALKRMRGSPMPAWAYMFARIVHAVLVASLLVVICAAFGAVFYQATLPTSTLPAFLLALVVGAATFCALGVAVTSVIPTSDAAPAIVNASVLPLMFISNVFIPLENPPAWIDIVAKIFPVRHFADALIGSFFQLNGSGLHANDLLVLGAWGAGGLIVAVRLFDWEPRI